MRTLSPEQQARQDLILEALREQQAYERSQRGKLVSKAKMTLKFFTTLAQLVAYVAVSIAIYKLIINLHI